MTFSGFAETNSSLIRTRRCLKQRARNGNYVRVLNAEGLIRLLEGIEQLVSWLNCQFAVSLVLELAQHFINF